MYKIHYMPISKCYLPTHWCHPLLCSPLSLVAERVPPQLFLCISRFNPLQSVSIRGSTLILNPFDQTMQWCIFAESRYTTKRYTIDALGAIFAILAVLMGPLGSADVLSGWLFVRMAWRPWTFCQDFAWRPWTFCQDGFMLDVWSGRHFVRSRNSQPWTFCQDSISSSTDCGNFWQLLADCGNFGQFLVDCGNKCKLLGTNGNFWQQIVSFGNKWKLLATNGNLWQLLATVGNFW